MHPFRVIKEYVKLVFNVFNVHLTLSADGNIHQNAHTRCAVN